jgi:hypothetical protein
MGGVACNGWRFWSLAGTETPARKAKAEPKAKPAKKAAKPAKPKAKKGGKPKSTKKAKSHAMRAKGDSYGCGACGESFPTQKAAVEHALTHTTA